MHELAETLAAGLVSVEGDLAREFEARLADSSTLAFRVAYSIVRQKQDAEDVAQDAFARAYRRFDQLRDRERFRAWLVRMPRRGWCRAPRAASPTRSSETDRRGSGRPSTRCPIACASSSSWARSKAT